MRLLWLLLAGLSRYAVVPVLWLCAGLLWRVLPVVVVGLGALLLWPSVLAGWAVRRRALPWAAGRWPARAVWGACGGAALLATAIPAGLALSGASPATFGVLVLGSGVLVPVVLASGAAAGYGQPWALAVYAALAAAWAAVLLATGWPQAAQLARWSVRRLTGEGAGGNRVSGHRTPDNARGTTRGTAAPQVAVKLKPVAAQRIATASYAETRFYARGLEGPELLSMCVGPASVGKSEFAVFAATRVAFDGGSLCGLATSRPRRTLLLSEMGGATLQPALRRWKLYAEPAGRLDAARLRLFLPGGHAGATIDVAYAADVYRPVLVDGEYRMAEWPAVIEAVRPLVEKGQYDRVIVDSLGEWLGSDGNDAMLRTLGACRQLTHAGAGVLLLHHTPRSDPYRPRGGTVIEAKLDIGFSVTGYGPGGMPKSREDSAREVRWFKTRFPDHTPPGSLDVERIWTGPLPDGAPRYRLRGEDAPAPAASTRERAAAPPDPTVPTLSPQAQTVADAFAAAGTRGATVREVAEATKIARQRVTEAVNALIGIEKLSEGEKVRSPKGGAPATRYYARTPGAAEAADRLLREALDA